MNTTIIKAAIVITVISIILLRAFPAPAQEACAGPYLHLCERSVSVSLSASLSRAAVRRISPPPGTSHGLVSTINAKLRRWVRPTGQCGFGETETLTTYYNSGRRTATGERFYPSGMTAAHRSLPFGTHLTVRNPKTGRSVTVRINDRGPFTIAKLDLAQGAAFAIGMRTSLYLCVSGFAVEASR